MSNLKKNANNAAAYAELARLRHDNSALRGLLKEWHDLFAPVRVGDTVGAQLIDRTAEAMATEFRYKAAGTDEDSFNAEQAKTGGMPYGTYGGC